MATRRSSPSSRTAESTPVASSAQTASRAVAGSSGASAEARPARRRAAAPKSEDKRASAPAVSADVRRGMIAKAAYLRAERRGFAHGSEEEDWLLAEKEVDALLSAGQGIPQ
jgi:Protein of unknown function (DUF2934)